MSARAIQAGLVRWAGAVALGALVVLGAVGSAPRAAAADPLPIGAAEVGALRVRDARILAPAAPDVAAAYFTIENHGDVADALVGVASAAAATTELHSTVARDGRLAMLPIERLDIAPGAEVTLAPGGYHVMLLGLHQPLQAGDLVTLTLYFERAGPVTLRVPVRPRADG